MLAPFGGAARGGLPKSSLGSRRRRKCRSGSLAPRTSARSQRRQWRCLMIAWSCWTSSTFPKTMARTRRWRSSRSTGWRAVKPFVYDGQRTSSSRVAAPISHHMRQPLLPRRRCRRRHRLHRPPPPPLQPMACLPSARSWSASDWCSTPRGAHAHRGLPSTRCLLVPLPSAPRP